MNNKSKLTVVVLITIVVLTCTSNTLHAGALAPYGGVGKSTYFTLGDIYNKLLNYNYSINIRSHPVSTTSLPVVNSGTFFTLDDIYHKLTDEEVDLISDNIRKGVTIFGITGTATDISIPPVYWQSPVSAPTNYLQLCFSAGAYELVTDTKYGTRDLACIPGNGLTSEGYGAKEYCENLNTEGSSAWRLPTKIELESALISHFILLGSPDSFSQVGLMEYIGGANFTRGMYWTNREVYDATGSSVPNDAVSNVTVGKYDGVTVNVSTIANKHSRLEVRCVHN